MTKQYDSLPTARRTLTQLVSMALFLPLGAGTVQAQIEEIIVTAQKREEGLQSVPIAISAFTGDTLKMSGIENTIDLQIVTPGLQTSRLAGGWVPRIRGIGSTDTSPGNESSVSTYVDGVYISGSFSGLLTLNNVERIEVLKGPQGTLFGRNATGGLIHVITKTPDHETSGNVELTYGNYDTKIFSGYITTGITDSIATDLAVRWNDQDEGYGENLTTGKDTYTDETIVARNKWLITPGEDTSITVAANYFDFDRDTANFYRAQKDPFDNVHDVNDYYEAEGWGGSLHIEHDFGAAYFVSISAYNDAEQGSHGDSDYTALPIRYGRFKSGTEAFTQEFQLLSPAESDIEWIVGAFYMDRESYMDPAGFGAGSLESGTSLLVGNHTQQDTTSWAVFAQGTYPFSEKTDLTLGVRYTEDELEYEGRALLYIPYPADKDPDLFFGTSPNPDSDEADSDEVTYRAVLNHQFTENVMAYASVNTGFKSGTFTILSVPGPVADPETLTAYEIGIKSDLFDRRLRLNAAAYIYDFKDFQTLEILGIESQLINAGKATIEGLEMDLIYTPTNAWNIKFGFNYMPEADYDDFKGCPGPIPGNPADDCSGSRIINTPEWDVSFGTDYSIDTSFGEILLVLNYQYMSDFPWDADHGQFPVFEEDSRQLVNARARWTSKSGNLYVDLYGNNLGDEEYLIFGNNANGQGELVLHGTPRTYGVTLGFDF